MLAELVLSLFPGIGLLDRAFEEQGFCVVRGPDVHWGGDVRAFAPPAGVFAGVIGGPPCQAHSSGRALAPAGSRQREDLIPEFERVVGLARPRWFVMECVPGSPPAAVAGYAVWTAPLHNRDFGAVQMRCRRWSFGVLGAEVVNLWRFLELEPLHRAEKAPAVRASGFDVPGRVRVRARRDGRLRSFPLNSRATKASVARSLELQGLPAEFFGSETPFTVGGQQLLVGNGVPMMMGRAVAAAVRACMKEIARPAH